MSLYTSVYWTKRAFVGFGILLVICSGYRIFKFIGNQFTKETKPTVELRAEIGFGKLDRLTLTPLQTPANYKPTEFRDSTLLGNLSVMNNYPNSNTRYYLANVFKILEQENNLTTSRLPERISKNLGITKDPVESSNTTSRWIDGEKELTINGQYLLIDYKNQALKKSTPPLTPNPTATIVPNISTDTSEAGRSTFEAALKQLGAEDSSFKDYKFTTTYLTYDKAKNTFLSTGNTPSEFTRINAERVYSSIVKDNKEAKTVGLYPNYLYSNNYIIIPTALTSREKPADYLVEVSIHNWKIDQEIKPENKNIQTYDIKTPRQAYDEMVKEGKYLISASEWQTRKSINIDELNGINNLEVFNIYLRMYEDVVNTGYIQPVYVFECQGKNNGKLYEIVYYVPAILDKHLN